MSSMKFTDNFQIINKQKLILVVGLVSFFLWLVADVYVLLSDILRFNKYLDSSHIVYNIGMMFYGLLFVCLAQYLKILNFRSEQIITYCISVFTIVAAIFNFIVTYNFVKGIDHNLFDVQLYTSLYSLVSIIINLLTLTLGVLFIIKRNRYIKGFKIVGCVCILKVVLSCVAYLFQTIGLQMNMYYGLFGDYKVVIFITYVVHFFTQFLLGSAIIYFLIHYCKSQKIFVDSNSTR